MQASVISRPVAGYEKSAMACLLAVSTTARPDTYIYIKRFLYVYTYIYIEIDWCTHVQRRPAAIRHLRLNHILWLGGWKSNVNLFVSFCFSATFWRLLLIFFARLLIQFKFASRQSQSRSQSQSHSQSRSQSRKVCSNNLIRLRSWIENQNVNAARTMFF